MAEPSTGAPARAPHKSRTGWGLLLRAMPMALQPHRLGLGFVAVGLMAALGSLFDWARGDIEPLGRGIYETLALGLVRGIGGFASGVVSLAPGAALSNLANALIATPTALARTAPWSFGALLVILSFIASLAGGAIARSVVVEAARDEAIPTSQAVRFASAKIASLWFTLLGPAITVGVLAGLVWIFGFLLMRLPGLDVAGAVLYGIPLLLGFALTLIVAGLVLGAALLIPAVAAENTDWIDACQRVYSYMLSLPGRYLLYGAALVAQGAAAVFVVAWLATATLNWTAALTGPATEDGAPLAGDVPLFGVLAEREGLEGTDVAVEGILGVWERLVLTIVAGFVFAFVFSAGSTLYLRMRELVDGEAIEDIWPRRSALDRTREGDIPPIRGSDAPPSGREPGSADDGD